MFDLLSFHVWCHLKHCSSPVKPMKPTKVSHHVHRLVSLRLKLSTALDHLNPGPCGMAYLNNLLKVWYMKYGCGSSAHRSSLEVTYVPCLLWRARHIVVSYAGCCCLLMHESMVLETLGLASSAVHCTLSMLKTVSFALFQIWEPVVQMQLPSL